jgi:predicted Zn-dependent peptidase
MRKRLAVLLLAAAALSAQVRLPRYSRQVLSNGAVIDLLPRPGVPLVSVRVLVKGGVESNPAGLDGLASVTADLLRRGTLSRTAERFSGQLDAIGATFSTRVDEQSTILTMEFMRKDTATALDLLADAVLRPAFPEEQVRKALAERTDASRALKDSPMSAAAQYYQVFYFGPGHPYGHPLAGDEVSLQRITREAIAGYHARMYSGANLIVVAAGDFEGAGMATALAAAFSGLPAGKPYQWQPAPPPSSSSGPRLLLVDKPDARQTYFWIGSPGITRTNPDRVPLWLVNTLFGGRFTSMLNEELRVKSGLTYGASSRVDENRLPGRITMASYTQTDSTEKAIGLALDVLKRLRENGITAEQLASVKAYVEGMFPPDRLETSAQLAAAIGELELFGLDRGEIDDLFARIDGVTLPQANAVAKKYFGAGDLVFVVVGNAAKIRDIAGKYAPRVVEIPITRPGFSAAP